MRVAIIPARGGSRRIPRKNIRPFFGKPIIAYSIEAAWESGLFDRVFVSTDDMEIARIASSYQCADITRPRALARDEVGTLAVVGHAARMYPDADYVCCIYATAPLLTPADINRGYQSLSHCDAAHCIAVGDNPLRDAGAFYWSTGSAARSESPYWDYVTVGELLPPERVCDINTESDWQRAERMYAELHKEAA